MSSLILDTSGDQTYLGWSEKGTLLSKKVLLEGKQLSKFLLPAIDSILQAQVPDFIAIGIGPGSYTGTRVGAMVAKSLSFAWNVPLISFSSKLLPDLETIASLTYEKILLEPSSSQIDLVYISNSP